MKKIGLLTGVVIVILTSTFLAFTNKGIASAPIYFTAGGLCRAVCVASINCTFFSTTGTNQASITTNGGMTAHRVYRNNTCTLPAFFKP